MLPLYQLLLNSPPLAQGWEQLLSAVRKRSSLRADLREMTISRVAVLNRTPYEFEAYGPHALKAGVSQIKIDTLRDLTQPPDAEIYSDVDRHVLTVTDTMTRNVDVPDRCLTR